MVRIFLPPRIPDPPSPLDQDDMILVGHVHLPLLAGSWCSASRQRARRIVRHATWRHLENGGLRDSRQHDGGERFFGVLKRCLGTGEGIGASPADFLAAFGKWPNSSATR